MFFQSCPLRKTAVATVLSLPIVALNVHSALAEQLVFQLQNESSIDIHYLFVSESGNQEWGEDILGDETIIESGEVTMITLADDSNACFYDIKAVAADGESSAEVYQVNLCEDNVVSLTDPPQ